MLIDDIPPVRPTEIPSIDRSTDRRAVSILLALFIGLCLAGGFAAPIAAQPLLDARLHVPTSIANSSGTQSTRVLLDHAQPLLGWSFGLCHDPTLLVVTGVDAGSDVLDLNGGAGPDFLETIVEPNGVRSTVVTGLGGGGVLPPGNEAEILVIAYQPQPLTVLPPSTHVSFCDTLGMPHLPIVASSPNGPLTPMVEDGVVILEPLAPFLVLEIPTTIADYDLATGAATVRVRPTLIDLSNSGLPVFGFRFGIRHQLGLLETPNVNIVGPIAALPLGQGLDFFLADFSPGGFTLEVLIDPFVPPMIDFTAHVPLVEIEYEAVNGVLAAVGTPVTTPLVFDNTLVSQGVQIIATIDVGSAGTSITPILVDGQVILLPGKGFVRGDCNGDAMFDLADPLRALLHLFQGGSPICQSACDANDDGSEDLGDAIYLLGVLFGNNPPPPPPNQCGVDPTPDGTECVAFPPCP